MRRVLLAPKGRSRDHCPPDAPRAGSGSFPDLLDTPVGAAHIARSVGSFAIRRLASLLPVWFGISLLSFALSAIIPGDPAAVLLQRQTGELPSDEAVAGLRRDMGLDDPLPVRYVRWLGDALAGDLGRSYRTGERVTAAFFTRLPATLLLAVMGVAGAIAIGVPLGVAAARDPGRAYDNASRWLAVMSSS